MIIGLMGVAGAGKDTAGAVLAKELGGVTLAFADPIKRWCKSVLQLTDEQLWGADKEKPLTEAQLNAIEPPSTEKMGVRGFRKTPLMQALAAACGETLGSSGINDDLEFACQVWWHDLKAHSDLTPRKVMQQFGTEFVRKELASDYWCMVGMNTAQALLGGGLSYSRDVGLEVNFKTNVNAVVITDVRFRNEVLAVKKAGGFVYRVDREGGSRTELKSHASEAEQQTVPRFWLDGILENRYGSKENFERAVSYVGERLRDRAKVLT